MEDQPVFFFNQAEQDDTGVDEEYTEDSIEDASKKKKKKRKELWAKLFDNKEIDQPKSEHKGFLRTFNSLFSKLTGVEKEKIVDTDFETNHKIGSLGIGMPLIENVESSFKDNNTDNKQEETGQFNNIDNEITNNDIKNVDINDEVINKDDTYINYENKDQNSFDLKIDSDLENQVIDDSIKENNNPESSSYNLVNNQDDNMPVYDVGEHSLSINEVERNEENENNLGSNTKPNNIANIQSKENIAGASLLGVVAAEELSKSNNEKLKKQAQKIKKHIEKTRLAEEKTKRELDELRKKQERQQAELVYKRFRTTKAEHTTNKPDNQYNLTDPNLNSKNKVPEDKVVLKQSNDQTFTNSRNKYLEIEREMYKDKQKLEKDMTQNEGLVNEVENEVIEKPNFEGRFITEKERDQQQEKLSANTLLTKSNNGGVNGGVNTSNKTPQKNINYKSYQEPINTNNQDKVLRDTKEQKILEYRSAVIHGFSAGIIVLVSFLVVVLVWSLVK